jgi:hypothetical protein
MEASWDCTPPPFQQLKLSPSTVKKFVPSVSNLYDYWGGKRLSQLLALLSGTCSPRPNTGTGTERRSHRGYAS